VKHETKGNNTEDHLHGEDSDEKQSVEDEKQCYMCYVVRTQVLLADPEMPAQYSCQ
jgi:hypothetical protein